MAGPVAYVRHGLSKDRLRRRTVTYLNYVSLNGLFGETELPSPLEFSDAQFHLQDSNDSVGIVLPDANER